MKQEKKFEEYKKTIPLQMDLFHNQIGAEKQYSNTIEIYDTLPKYFYGNPEREKGKKGEYLPILERKFDYKGIKHSMSISPAGIVNKEGKTILVVTHEHEIANMCNRIITLKDGVIMTDVKIT